MVHGVTRLSVDVHTFAIDFFDAMTKDSHLMDHTDVKAEPHIRLFSENSREH